MKKILLPIVIIILTLSGILFGQYRPEVTIKEILKEGVIRTDELEKKSVEIVHLEFDIVHKEANRDIYRNLGEEWTYGVGVFGDPNRISDIDVEVNYLQQNGKWKQVAIDNSTRSDAIVAFKPPASGVYRITVHAHTMITPYTAGHYGLIIFHE